MTPLTRISLLVVLLVVAVFGIVAQFIPVDKEGISVGTYTTHAGELTRDVLVGQTFHSDAANLSGVSVMFATYTGRARPQDVHFSLRDSTESSENIRQARASSIEFGDNQLYHFAFEPIADSRGKDYFFYVTAPDGLPGQALTVSVNSQDPYHLGSAYIVRGQGPLVTSPQALASSGKQTVDVVFSTTHRIPFNQAVISNTRHFIVHTWATWDESVPTYILWTRAALPVVLFGLMLLYVRWIKHHPNSPPAQRATIILVFLFAIAVGWRIMYAVELPLINDEGNYLYDARMLREGTLAGGDGYVKAPLVIGWLAVWQMLGGNTLLAGRLSSIIIGAATLFPLYYLARELKDSYSGLLAATAWAVFGAPVVFNVYILTQPLAVFFGVSGIALLWLALRGKIKRAAAPGRQMVVARMRWFVLAGILLGLGVASRKSILALGLVPLLLILIEGRSWRARLNHFISVGAGFLLVLVLFLAGAYAVYGEPGIWEAIGLNSAEDGVAVREISELENIRAYSLRGMTPFFRESLPLILLSLLGWGYLLETTARLAIKLLVAGRTPKLALRLFDQVLPKLTWALPLLVYSWAFRFFFEYEGSAFHIFGMYYLWYVMGIVLLLAALWPRPQEESIVMPDEKAVQGSTQPRRLPPNLVGGLAQHAGETPTQLTVSATYLLALVAGAVLPAAWIGGIAFFYANWIKFHANYISEFLPPLVILAGVGAYGVWQRSQVEPQTGSHKPLYTILRRAVLLIAMGTCAWAIFVSNHITYLYEHTGTFGQRAVQEAAQWAQQNIPLTEPLFTGAAVVPYLSGHHVALDIAHPRWYAYEETRTNPERLNVFLPPIEDMLNAYRSSRWFLHEAQTGFSFMMEYTEIEAGLARDWQEVYTVENGGNPLTFYRRITGGQ